VMTMMMMMMVTISENIRVFFYCVLSTNCAVASGGNVTVLSLRVTDCSYELELPGTSQLYRTWLICGVRK